MNAQRFVTPGTLATALAASITLAACQREPDPPVPRSDAVATPAAVVGDAAITVAVNTALAKDADLSALRIDVDTANGRVRLTGRAPDEAARQRASSLARAVDGVKSVDNQLELPPAS